MTSGVLLFLGVWLSVFLLSVMAFGEAGGLLVFLAGSVFCSYEVYRKRKGWWVSSKEAAAYHDAVDAVLSGREMPPARHEPTTSFYFPDVRMMVDDGRYFIRTNVAGISFRQDAASLCYAGQSLTLLRDPENPHDVNAVSVFADGNHIGFIPATLNAGFAAYLDSGRQLCADIDNVVGGAADKPAIGIYINLYLPDDVDIEFDEWDDP